MLSTFIRAAARQSRAGRPAAIIAVCVAAASTVQAHAVLDQREAKLGAGYKAVIKIGHGCEGAATTRVSVEIPEGIIGVKPMPKHGWKITTEKAAYARAYKHYHGDLSEGVKRITWEGGPLPDDFYDEFVFASFVARELTPDTTIHFPVLQTCEKGELAWTEVPAAGQSSHDLKFPAASLNLVAAPQQVGATSSSGKPAGPISVEAPWTRATPGGVDLAAGYGKITNTGKEPDRLTGGTFERAKKVEVHTMSNDGGVMKMRHLAEGVEIPAGQTVELKPGGLHLMLMGLSSGLKAGETLKGTLMFEKAGAVDVVYTVAPLGSEAPPVGGNGGHHNHH